MARTPKRARGGEEDPAPASSADTGEAAARTVERFRSGGSRDRWLAFLAFDHPVLPPPLDVGRRDEDFLIVRGTALRRRIRDGRVSDAHVPALFLQAAALVASLQSAGFWASADDLLESGWEWGRHGARLRLDRTPEGVSGGTPVPAAAALAPFLDRIARRDGRVREEAASEIRRSLESDDALRRRGDHWVSLAYAGWQSLRSEAAAPVRLRTLGTAGLALASVRARARIEKARALLSGDRRPRVFAPEAPCLLPGEAIGLAGSDLETAVRRLRADISGSDGLRALWICAGESRWDALSLAALAAAVVGQRSVPAPEVLWIPDALPAPLRADEWRAELSVCCGTARASLRFHERLAEAAASGADGLDAARRMVAHAGWAAFVSDPTGDAPLPPAAAPDALPAPRAPRRIRRRAPDGDGAGPSPREAFGRALESGDPAAALASAEAWRRSETGAGAGVDTPPRRWFEMSARLSAFVSPPWPAWLESLEAERELAGGRPAAAEACLARALRDASASPAELRSVCLRAAEVAVARGRAGEAAAMAARWRREHPDAPAPELVRSLELEAAGAARAGDAESALRLLDEAEARSADLSEAVRVGVLLARADVLARTGRFPDERSCSDRAREIADTAADQALAARVLAREALGLAERREFDGALARLEEARRILRDDPVESARIAIDLAATLYHAGRLERCAGLLEEAAALAVAAGREDLGRIARGNLVLWAIAGEDWAAAAAGADSLLASARRDGDATWTLVALHHRARLALKRGRLPEAQRDNGEARALAEAIGDRLEIGELWLEEGDRAALEGNAPAAREAYGRAAEDPPDRCDTGGRAQERLREIDAWERDEAAAAGLVARARPGVARGEYDAAEAVARWSRLAPGRVPEDLRAAAAGLLRGRGGAALARLCLPDERASSSVFDGSGLRALRDVVAGALAGEEPGSRLPLGLAGVALAGPGGEDVVRLGSCGGGDPGARVLRAGAEQWLLRLWPSPADADAEAAALVIETLLFRFVSPDASADFSEGWRQFGVVSADRAMEEPYRRLHRFAPKSMTVLVLGESGSGKEAVARAVHALSPRASGPFVAVNVSAIPATLVESELFGHARGAFTGADRDRAGLLEDAARGTIFFDEIGDLAAPLQAKLLRALQDREIRRVGENRSRRIDVRVVSATSRDLGREVEAGRFREDLYYRLYVAVIRLPPLRDRGRDALLLARHFLSLAAREDGRGGFEIGPDAAAAILGHAWPGNVRELQSAIVSAAALADGRRIGVDLLPEAVRRAGRASDTSRGYRSSVDAHRRDLIMEALERAGGNRSRAARDLRLSRQALLYLIRELNVTERARNA